MIPIISKPTRIYNQKATTIYYILTNSHTETMFKTAILPCDVSDHFSICLIIPFLRFSTKNNVIYFYQRSFNKQSIINSKRKRFEIHRQEIETKVLGSLMTLKTLVNIRSVCIVRFKKTKEASTKKHFLKLILTFKKFNWQR